MKKCLLLIIILFVIPFAISVGVSPPSASTVFEPGMRGEINFYFRNNLDKTTTLMATLEGELAEYAEIESAHQTTLKPDEKVYTKVKFELPDDIGGPGWHTFNVVVTESIGTGGVVGARGQVMVPIKFFVQYPGKKLEIDLNARDGSVGEEIRFDVTVRNVGTEAVENTNAKIKILKGDELVGEASSEPFSIQPMETKKVEASWNAESISQGSYGANASVSYGAGMAYAYDEFRIGTFDLLVEDYTKKIGKGTVNKFNIDLLSKWNKKIENVFVDATVYKGNSEIESFSAATQSIDPWKTKTVTGFLDAKEIDEGEYSVKMNISFSSQGETKTKTFEGRIEVVAQELVKDEQLEGPAEEDTSTEENEKKEGIAAYLTMTNILIGLVIILVIINVIILLKKKKNEKKEEIQ